jgi:hypothetical protein
MGTRLRIALLAVMVAAAPASRLAVAMIEVSLPFVPDTTLQRVDSIPPPAPVIKIKEVYRGQGDIYLGGGIVGSGSNAETGSISLDISSSDESSFAGQAIGCRFHFVDGALPKRLETLPEGSWAPNGWDGRIWITIFWSDGETWKQDPFSFRMFVTVIDKAGNESPPSNVIEVAHDGNTDGIFARHVQAMNGSVDVSMNGLEGEWIGKDEDGAKALLKMSGHQFHIASGEEIFDGFAQVWKDEEGKQQMTVDMGGGVHLTGPYEATDNRLKLWLRVPTTYKYYDLRRKKS